MSSRGNYERLSPEADRSPPALAGRLRDKYKRLGKDVPIVRLRNERPQQLEHWRSDASIADLTAAPYYLELVDQ